MLQQIFVIRSVEEARKPRSEFAGFGSLHVKETHFACHLQVFSSG